MIRTNVIKATLLLTALALVHCTGASENERSASTASGKGEGSDDGKDLEPTLPVPMGLVGPEAFAQASQKLGVLTRSASDPTLADATPDAVVSPASTDPNDMVRELRVPVEATTALMGALFGADGLFGTAALNVPAGKGRAFRLTGAAASLGFKYAVVRADQTPGSTRPYLVDLYAEAAVGYERRAFVAFAPQGDAGAFVDVMLYHGDDATGHRVFDGRYDSVAGTLTFAFGPALKTASDVVGTVGKMTMGGDTILQLARSFVRPPHTDAQLDFARGARFAPTQLRDGDTQALQLALGASGGEVRWLALVPGAELGPLRANLFPAFQTHSFGHHGHSYVIEIVRERAINPACESLGDALRGLFAGRTAPDAVASLPGNGCADGDGASEAAVADALRAACLAVASGPTLGLSLRGPDGALHPTPTDICGEYKRQYLDLNNPFLYGESDGVRARIPAADGGAEHKRLTDQLTAASAFPAVDWLQSVSWPAAAAAGEEDFVDAPAKTP